MPLLVPLRMRIRSATVEDVQAVLPMVRALCAMHGEMDSMRYGFLSDVVERYARWLPERAADARSVFVVAETERVVGFLVATVEKNIPIYTLGEFGFIHDVWVDPRARGAGAARGMVSEAVAKFAAMGVKQVRLETAAANDGARKMFAACGFRVGAVEMVREQ